ncbi:branched-chain amino acid ABC transporter permease [Mesorhizobium shangrilense]|uniref:Branched-chain amino acid ABC transporter permease n=1 Tax=Mesorhizobium shangrilense TaxID=460060 RepID=A0ABV2DGY4_9HYPH
MNTNTISTGIRPQVQATSLARTVTFWAIVVGALYVTASLLTDQHLVDLMFQIMLAASLAGAWNIVGGFGGQIALGHAAFFGVGAYTSTLLFQHFQLTPWVGMLGGAFLAALLATLIGAVTLRLRGPFFAMTTVAFTELVRIIVKNWDSVTGGSRGLWIPWEPNPWNFNFSDRNSYLFVAITLAVLVYSATAIIANTKLGYLLNALREDVDAARSVGVKATRARLLSFAISAAFAAVGGTVYAQYTLSIDPASVMSFDISIQMALMSAVGGLGTVIGPALGAIAVVTSSSLLRGWFGGELGALHLLLYGVLLILVMLFARGGIIGVAGDLKKRFSRKSSQR